MMGADETIVKLRGKAKLVGFVADAESGKLLGIDMPVERDSDGFSNWLKKVCGSVGSGSRVTEMLCPPTSRWLTGWVWCVRYALRMRVRTLLGACER